MRLLSVEDEPAAALILAKGLREHAYAVDVSGDGEDASFRLATTDYDAVILDVTLQFAKTSWRVGPTFSSSAVPYATRPRPARRPRGAVTIPCSRTAARIRRESALLDEDIEVTANAL